MTNRKILPILFATCGAHSAIVANDRTLSNGTTGGPDFGHGTNGGHIGLPVPASTGEAMEVWRQANGLGDIKADDAGNTPGWKSASIGTLSGANTFGFDNRCLGGTPELSPPLLAVLGSSDLVFRRGR